MIYCRPGSLLGMPVPGNPFSEPCTVTAAVRGAQGQFYVLTVAHAFLAFLSFKGRIPVHYRFRQQVSESGKHEERIGYFKVACGPRSGVDIAVVVVEKQQMVRPVPFGIEIEPRLLSWANLMRAFDRNTHELPVWFRSGWHEEPVAGYLARPAAPGSLVTLTMRVPNHKALRGDSGSPVYWQAGHELWLVGMIVEGSYPEHDGPTESTYTILSPVYGLQCLRAAGVSL